MRLIDADALKKAIEKEFEKNFYSDYEPSEVICRVYDDCIDNVPTVTPDMAQVLAYESGKASAERPQGKWLWLHDTPNAIYKWSCNKCGRGVKEQENFCPNCGAQMDKGEE